MKPTKSILQSRAAWYGTIYGLLLAFIYFSTYDWLIRGDWLREDYNYCYLIPFVLVYLIWEKKKQWLKEASMPSWIGLPVLMSGILLFWLGDLAGEYFSLYISSWLVIVGLLWLHVGWKKNKDHDVSDFCVSFPFSSSGHHQHKADLQSQTDIIGNRHKNDPFSRHVGLSGGKTLLIWGLLNSRLWMHAVASLSYSSFSSWAFLWPISTGRHYGKG